MYDTTWGEPGQTLATRERVYAKMPNVTTLRMRVDGFLGTTVYLRPSLRTIHLDFRLSFHEGRNGRPADLLHSAGILECFKALEQLLMDPQCELEELTIQFLPDVTLALCIPDAHVVEYDEYGAVYEDEDWSVSTQRIHPSECLAFIKERNTLHRIGQALLKVLAIRPLKAITLPAEFPSADAVLRLYPLAIVPQKVDIEEANRRVVETINHYHKEHSEKYTYLATH